MLSKDRKTFHEHGATEVRMTVLSGKKRVDFHVFEADSILIGRLKKLFEEAKDGHKYELAIEDGKLKEFESTK
jgi:hypothetical protein